jgi:hypothetical protein
MVSLALAFSARACSPRASEAPAAPSTTSGNDTTTYAQNTSFAGNAYPFCVCVTVTFSSSSESCLAERIAAKVALSRLVSPARRARFRAARSDASSRAATRAKNERAARRTPSSRTASANASKSNVSRASSFFDETSDAAETAFGRVARKRFARRLVVTFSAANRRQTRCALTAARVSHAVVFVFVFVRGPLDESSTRSSDDVFDDVLNVSFVFAVILARLLASAATSLDSRRARCAETRPRLAAAARATRAFAARALARVRSISCACGAIARPRPVDHTRVGREWVSRASRAKRPRLFVAGGLIFVFFFVHRIIARHAKTLAVHVSSSISRSRGS